MNAHGVTVIYHIASPPGKLEPAQARKYASLQPCCIYRLLGLIVGFH